VDTWMLTHAYKPVEIIFLVNYLNICGCKN